jgi:PrsW family intramembrane metalloprotease
LNSKKVHWPSVGQLALAVLTVLLLWSGASALAIWGMVGLVSRSQAVGDPLPMFLMATTSLIGGLLMLPSAYYALWRLIDRPAVDSQAILRRLRLQWWILALPLVLLVGHFVASHPKIAWLGLPFLHPLAIGIPTVWLLYFAIRRLPLGSSQRMWGVFGSGLTLGPFLIFVLESLVGLAFLLALVLYLYSLPGMMDKILQIASLVEQGQSPNTLIEDLKPIFTRPVVIFGILLFGAVAVPIIEEALKPIGVWLLFGRKLAPAAGFAAGALSGAGYALIESLALTSNGEEWSTLVLARSGTSVVHILTAGLTGWALAMAWQKRRVFQLLLAYLCAVTIHGLWNGLTLMYSFNLLTDFQDSSWTSAIVHAIGPAAPLALVLLAMGCFIALVAINRSLRRSSAGREPASASADTNENPGESML